MKCNCGSFINPAWKKCLVCGEGLNGSVAVKDTPAVGISIIRSAPSVETIFTREYRRLSIRLSRVMDADRDSGYLSWTRQHNPELWRLMEGARMAWDTNERLESLKSGRIAWRDYRRLLLIWAKLHVKGLRRHRDWLRELADERSAILEYDAGLTRQEAEKKSGYLQFIKEIRK